MTKHLTVIITALLFCGCMQQGAGKSQTANSSSTVTSDKPVNQLIFGRYCGRCRSQTCSPMYKADLVNKTLSLDNSSNYNMRQPLNFSKQLPTDAFSEIEKLVSSIPDSLYLTTEKRFGCPDCADQCGLFIQINKEGKVYDFELDNQLANMTGYIVPFATRLQELITKLQESK